MAMWWEKHPEWVLEYHELGIQALGILLLIAIVGFLIYIIVDDFGWKGFFILIGLFLFICLVLFWPFIFL